MSDIMDPKSSRARILELEEAIKVRDYWVDEGARRILQLEARVKELEEALRRGHDECRSNLRNERDRLREALSFLEEDMGEVIEDRYPGFLERYLGLGGSGK